METPVERDHHGIIDGDLLVLGIEVPSFRKCLLRIPHNFFSEENYTQTKVSVMTRVRVLMTTPTSLDLALLCIIYLARLV